MASHSNAAPPALISNNQHVIADHDENVNASETSSTTVADPSNTKQSRPVNHAHFVDNEDKTFSEKEGTAADGTRELTEDECRDELGFGFSTAKKW